MEVVYHVKSWNDNYGHASGDALLRELAVLLRAAATDPTDLVARNGGDEFCVVFADSEKSRAVERAERLRTSIADARYAYATEGGTRRCGLVPAASPRDARVDGIRSHPYDIDEA